MYRITWIVLGMMIGGFALGGIGVIIGWILGIIVSSDIAGQNDCSSQDELDQRNTNNVDMFDMTDDIHQGVNPGSGMPMTHKNSGFDVGGNPRGQNLDDLMD